MSSILSDLLDSTLDNAFPAFLFELPCFGLASDLTQQPPAGKSTSANMGPTW